MDEKIKKLREGQKASLIDTVGTIFLAVIKAVVGLISGSVALTADSIHDLSDALTTVASWVGLKISERKPNEKFPYGYYKAENLATLFICFFFFYGGFEILMESWNKLFSVPNISYPTIALIVPIISAVYAYYISRYLLKVGKKIFSQSLIAIAEEAKIHIAIAASVFIGILCSYFHIPYVEALVGIGLSFMIFKIAFVNAKEALFALMDVSPGKEVEKSVAKIIRSVNGVKNFHNLKLRRSGPFIFGEVAVEVAGKVDVKKAHKIAYEIESKAQKEIENLDKLTVYIEPSKKMIETIAIPSDENKILDSKIAKNTSRAKYFIILKVDKNKKKILKKKIKKNEIKKPVRMGLAVAKFLLKEGVDAIIVKEIGDITYHTLSDNFVTVYKGEGKVKDVLKKYFNNTLKVLNKPTKTVG